MHVLKFFQNSNEANKEINTRLQAVLRFFSQVHQARLRSQYEFARYRLSLARISCVRNVDAMVQQCSLLVVPLFPHYALHRSRFLFFQPALRPEFQTFGTANIFEGILEFHKMEHASVSYFNVLQIFAIPLRSTFSKIEMRSIFHISFHAMLFCICLH